MIDVFDNLELKHFYENKTLWKGCFGCMSIITHDYLVFINKLYNIRKLLPFVLNRYNRCSFERVVACLLQKHGVNDTLLGDIHNYSKVGIKFEDRDKYKHLPIIKVWTGR